MSNTTRRILILLALALLTLSPVTALSQGTPEAHSSITESTAAPTQLRSADGWLYALRKDGTIMICGAENPSVSVLTVPFTLDGMPVTAIGPHAFSGLTALEGILIHAGVNHFDPAAFEDLNATVYAYNGAPVLRFTAEAGVPFRNLSAFDLTEDVLDFCDYSTEYIRSEGTRVWASNDIAHIFVEGTRFLTYFDGNETETVRQVESIAAADGGVYLSCSLVPAHEVLRSFSFDIDDSSAKSSQRSLGTNYIDTKTHTSKYQTKDGLLSVKFDIDFNIDPEVSGSLSYDKIEDFRCLVNYTADITITGTLGGTLLSGDMLKLSLESLGKQPPVEIDLLPLPKKISIPQKLEFTYDTKLKLDLKLVGTGKVHLEGYDGFIYENGLIVRTNDVTRTIEDATLYGELTAGFSTSAVLKIPFYGKFLSLTSGLGIKTKTKSLPSASTLFYCVEIPLKVYFDASLTIEPPIFRKLSYQLLSMELPAETYHLEIPSASENYWALHLGKKCTINPDSVETIQLISGTDQIFEKLLVMHGVSVASSLDYEPLAELEGNEFVGWFDQPVGGTKYDLAAAVTPGYPDILYAHFRKPPVTVTLDYGWDLIQNTTKQLYPGSKLEAPKINQRLGYKLVGWFANHALWDFENMLVPDTDIYIHAVWQEAPGYNPFAEDIDSIRHADSDAQYDYYSGFLYSDMLSTGLQGLGLNANDDSDLAKLHSVISVTGYNGVSPAFVPPDYVNAIKVKMVNGVSMSKGALITAAMPQHCLIVQNMNNEPNMLYVQLNDKLAIIDSSCFANNSLLQHYDSGSSLRKIGNSAFMNCISLLTADVKDCIDVGSNAFRNCISLVQVSGSMNHVQANTFNNCAALTQPPILINALMRTGAFANCTSLKNLSFVGDTTFYPDDYGFFSNCTALEELYFGGSVNNLPLSYENLESLKSVIITGDCNSSLNLTNLPALESIRIDGNVNGRIYLDNVPNLRSIQIGGTVSGGITLCDMPMLSTVEFNGEIIPGSNTISITNCAALTELDLSRVSCTDKTKVYLYDNPSLQNVVLPETLQIIARRMFANCSSITTLTLPSIIMSVEAQAFYNCASLTSLTLNEGLITLGSGILDYSPNITRLYIPDSVTVFDTPFSRPDQGGRVLSLICTSNSQAETYAANTAWLSARRPDDTRYTLCFSSNYKSSSSSYTTHFLNAGDDISSIAPKWTPPSGTYFSGWYLDAECTIPYDLSMGMPRGDTCLYMGKTLASQQFTYENNGRTCTITGYVGSAETVSIPEAISSRQVTGIAENAFSGSQIRSLTLPGAMTDVTGASFSGLETLESIHVYGETSGIQVINGALYTADGKTLLYLPSAKTDSFVLADSTKTVGAQAMKGSRASAVIFNEGLSHIESLACADMLSLRELSLPSTLETIGDGAFKGCAALSTITLRSEPTFGSYVFSLLAPIRAYGPLSDTLRTFFSNYLIAYNAHDLFWVSDGEIALQQEIGQGEQFPRFSNIAKPGFVLEGWKASGSETLWDFAQDVMPDSSLTLHAVWSPVWQANKDGMITAYNSLAGSQAEVPETVQGVAVTGLKAGAMDASVTRVLLPSCVTVIEDGAFAARPTLVADEGSAAHRYALTNGLPFEKRRYAIIFDSAGGSQVDSMTLAKDDALLLPVPVKDLCSFAGWYDNDVLFASDIMPGRDLFLTAAWNEPSGYIPLFRTELSKDGLWITGYIGAAADVTLPLAINGQTVLGVKSGAFRNNTVIESLTVPDGFPALESEALAGSSVRSVEFLGADTSLGTGVLRGCSLLSTLTLPAGLAEIPAQLAQNAYSLQNVNWPESLVSISDRAFENCVSLVSSLPETIKNIGRSAFENCDSLQLSSLPAKTLSIGERAFYGCDGITAFALPEGLKSLPNDLFSGCSSLESVTLPATLSAFNGSAFAGCENLGAIHIAAENPVFSSQDGLLLTADGRTLLLCPAGRAGETLILPEGLTELGASSLSGCCFSQIILPETLEIIHDRAMENCVYLTSIILPGSLSTLGSAVFNGCVQLSSVTLPEDLVSIEADTFPSTLTLNTDSDWNTLRALLPAIKAGQPVEITPVITPAAVLSYSDFGDGIIITGLMSNIPGAVLPAEINGKPVLAVAEGAFNDLLYLDLPETVTTLEDGSLTGCPDLRWVTGGEGVISAGRYAAEGTHWANQDYVHLGSVLMACNSTSSSIRLSGSYPIIGADAFRGLTTLGWLSISGVQSIGDRAFMDCKNLYTIADSESVTALGIDLIKGSGLTDYTVTFGRFMLKMSPYASSTYSFPGGLSGVDVMLNGAMDGAPVSILVIDAENCLLSSGCATGCQTLRFLDARGVTDLTIEEGALSPDVTVCAQKNSAIWNRALELGLSVRESIPDLLTLYDYNLPVTLSLGSSEWMGTSYSGAPITLEDVVCLSSDESIFTVEAEVNTYDYGDSVSSSVYLTFYPVSAGSATLTLGITDATNQYPVTVVDDRMYVSNVPAGEYLYIAVGESFQLEMMDSSGNPLTGFTCSVSSYADSCLQVSPSGLITGLSEGSLYMYIEKEGYRTVSLYVNVIPAPSGLVLGSPSIDLYPGSYAYVPVTLSGTTHGRLTAIVDDPSVAEIAYLPIYWSISNGSAQANITIRGLQAGQTHITLTDTAGHSAVLQVSVSPVLVTNLYLTPYSLDLETGEYRYLTANVMPVNTTNQALVWESSDTNVVTVSDSGMVYAVGAGTATITASTTDGSNLSASCTVRVLGVYIDGPDFVYSGTETQYIAKSPSGNRIPSAQWSCNAVDAETFVYLESGILHTDPTFEEDYVITLIAFSEDSGIIAAKNVQVLSDWHFASGFTLPASIKTVAESSFSGAAFTSVRCPYGLERIDRNAFSNCASLTAIYLPATVSTIDKTAFDGCSSHLTFYVQAGSYAESFALEHGFNIDVVSSMPQ